MSAPCPAHSARRSSRYEGACFQVPQTPCLLDSTNACGCISRRTGLKQDPDGTHGVKRLAVGHHWVGEGPTFPCSRHQTTSTYGQSPPTPHGSSAESSR